MKYRILLFLLLLAPTLLTPQQYIAPNQDGCALQKRLEAMSHSQFKKLLAKAQAGDPAAQYLVGSTYQVGGPVPRDFDEAERWFVKCAEQRYRPPETGVCYINLL
jgi:TPR repeat protein